MIVVLADDLTGAAELAGIGAAHGLRAEVWIGRVFELESRPDLDLVAIDCGTRSLTESEAGRRTSAITEDVVAILNSEQIFKKTDSVMRGHVAIECAAVARASAKNRVLLVPANPSRQRCIVDGRYFINGIPLSDTVFAEDPEFPARSSDVATLLRNTSGVTMSVPEAATASDVTAIALTVSDDQLPAGGADFFAAILQRQGWRTGDRPDLTAHDQEASLWISGSHAAWLRGLPDYCGAGVLSVQIAPSCPSSLPALLAIGDGKDRPAQDLLDSLVSAALRTIDQLDPRFLFVEGGATASALADALGWNRFVVSAPIEEGIGILSPVSQAERTLVVKPGSYPWPSSWGVTC